MHLLRLATIVLICISPPVFAETIPGVDECSFIVLRTSEGWWLRIKNDTSGSYGFGTLPERIDVQKGTFDFMQIYLETRKTLTETRKNSENPYIAVSYFAPGASSAREYYLSLGSHWLTPLFLAARANTLSPAHEFEVSSHRKIKSFWEKNPYLPSENAGPDNSNELRVLPPDFK